MGASHQHQYLEVGVAHQHPDWQSDCLVLSFLVLDVEVEVEVGALRQHQYLEVGVACQHPDQQSDRLVLSFLALDMDMEVEVGVRGR